MCESKNGENCMQTLADDTLFYNYSFFIIKTHTSKLFQVITYKKAFVIIKKHTDNVLNVLYIEVVFENNL